MPGLSARTRALKAAWLEDACDLVVPSLSVCEVGNVLGLKHPSTAASLLQAMIDLGLREAAPHVGIRDWGVGIGKIENPSAILRLPNP